MLEPRASAETASEPFNEMRDPQGNMRPHWERYFEYLDTMGLREAKSRWTKAKQLLQENGASFSVYGDVNGAERPFRLSPIPLLLDNRDWEYLSRGIAQRARLLGSVLADVYGPQRTLMAGTLPSELIFDNPGFLRPLHGMSSGRTCWLPIYGIDLIRDPNGHFKVLEDCTQAPAGMGYALENRIVVAQVLPDLLRHCNVERLVGFFRQFRERLQGLAPHNRDAPRIALLTPGPYSSTYFEQTYLAKYLGLSLVQGEDLAVRDDRVYLKTLGGLQPIDVLLRRVFDDFCDPLELRPESELGVPGLVQAIRSGNVQAVNPLGTGILETPAILAYLPDLCRTLLNEELLLPSVPTFYCGDPDQLSEALDQFEQMVIKSTYTRSHADSIFVNQLDSNERQSLRQRICAAPESYVAQRFIPSSKTPVIADGELHSRAFVLRCFATSDQPSDYQVMPGGLALVATTDDELAVSLHRGARSKDVWVLSDDIVREDLLRPPSNPTIELSRGGGDLPSRVADNLYWLGRYTERAESIGRLTRVVGARLSEFPSERELLSNEEIPRMLHALRLQVQFLDAKSTQIRTLISQAETEAEFVSAIIESSTAGSVVSTLHSVLRVSRVVRDRISYDTWRILASLDESIEQMLRVEGRGGIAQLVNELNHLVIKLAGFSGLVMESMTRGFAWRFLDMGRRLERAVALVTLLRATFVAPCEREAPLVEAILDVADSGMTYRRRYPASLQPTPAIDLLLADDANPRSVIFQIKTLGEHINSLPPLANSGVRSAQQRLVLSATSQIELSDMGELCHCDPTTHRRQKLEQLLEQLAALLPALSDSLTETYLYHANVARHLQHQEPRDGAISHLRQPT